ncbi:hypothetical protein SEVIR_6G097900v4 [Setaria viridis]|uniref:DOMON domain-containing protein n=2 Tax=Setaria TaxID=4554 RepID=K3YJ94_SETIT|nr:auxin-induced in root cultures protein 12 [Setaria italica]XP_034599457.1 auxin-induced in root cultures protein 12-like [Setaria viridis]TKW10065.1 hypothetical protein SEVIR_6G097900v2 [Setaria viridis]
MASTPPLQLALLLLVVALPAAMSASCAGEHFPSGRTYVTCEDLPSLGAALHWTYDASVPSLSLAFVAAPAAPGGWVAWGINPSGGGMVGAQALLVLAGDAATSAASAVRTYNITGYAPLGKASTPIAFQATGLAADVGVGGKVRLYATLRLDTGMKKVVNHVWQVGSSVTRGAPDIHAMDAENLAARGKLVLSDGAAASPPALAGGPSSSGEGSGDGSPPLSRTISRAADTARVSAPALVLLALLGFLTTTMVLVA